MNSLEDFKRILLEACILVAFGALFGLMLNSQLVIDAFAGKLTPQRSSEAVEDLSAIPVPILMEEVLPLVERGALIVDARIPELYDEGHIEGAVSLPLVEVESALPEFLRSVPGDKTIVIYCSGFGCPDSFDLGMILNEEGYTDIRVFEGGFPEWRDAGLPVTVTDP